MTVVKLYIGVDLSPPSWPTTLPIFQLSFRQQKTINAIDYIYSGQNKICEIDWIYQKWYQLWVCFLLLFNSIFPNLVSRSPSLLEKLRNSASCRSNSRVMSIIWFDNVSTDSSIVFLCDDLACDVWVLLWYHVIKTGVIATKKIRNSATISELYWIAVSSFKGGIVFGHLKPWFSILALVSNLW